MIRSYSLKIGDMIAGIEYGGIVINALCHRC